MFQIWKKSVKLNNMWSVWEGGRDVRQVYGGIGEFSLTVIIHPVGTTHLSD